MTYAGIQVFMEKLKQLINCNDNPLISIPSIICERPQFQLLHDVLGSMTQTLFIDRHQDLETLNDLKKRFIYAAEEAQYIVDMFLSNVHDRNNGNIDDVRRSFKSVVYLFLSCVHVRNNEHFLNLDDVRRSFKSVHVEFMSMKMDSSRTSVNQSAPAPAPAPASTSISKGSKKLSDGIVVGLDGDVELIRDKLVEDQKKLDVVSIVGMGGIGKTTLATKVFNDGYVKHHFHVRVWVTVSQTYDKRAVLIQILASIRVKITDLDKATDSRLREMVHKHLIGRRYLIVIDDIWDVEAWDNLKLFFPHNNTGSRILITSRLIEVAKHANSVGLIHHLGYLNKERSWELLTQKVFHGSECPKWSIKPGMQIVENCKGIPLAVVVIAGVLTKEAWNKKFWMETAERTSSYIVDEENGCLETLGLSYSHLPLHLRECFLYLGGFPEDHKFKVQWLIWLWVAEGFIQEDGNRSLEDIAEGYVMDLIDRNLVIVERRRNSNGAAITCKVHDLVRELCLRKAREEQFILETERQIVSSSDITPVRKFINTYDPVLIHLSTQNLRSILWFSDFIPLSTKYFRSFVLLRVLDLQKCRLKDYPKGMELPVHLRFLAIWNVSVDFPSSICNLWNLQTLIYNTSHARIVLPSNLSDLVNLRHLLGWNSSFSFLSTEKPMNLQTVSHLVLEDKAHSFQKYFPCIKELKCTTASNKQNDFKSLTSLESLTLVSIPKYRLKNHITFPATLKTLTLAECGLQWSDMSLIQSLPNLQVLKLSYKAFQGSCWNTDGQEFPQLKFLRLSDLNLQLWDADKTSFPCLKQLEFIFCLDLEEIPLEVGDIPTLELIKVKGCRRFVGESVRRIQQEQQDMGNYDLEIDVIVF